ncbi:Two component regulator three Y domain protein [Aequorivita sp. F47161]|uniref:Two component regulator three Y domain protein n=1 Tax=Aequorivita vitellina TaxID=2874475 RepID=A0A9X1QU50_9FLAO|nr:Two component regulator three Y domain protein [Aequorivita vitellina]MCG2418365.1 Two component regulator three Y domain protein [Aequorivita vitellina]
MKTTILTCFFLFIASIAVAEISKQDKEILLDLYSSTNGQKWNMKWDLNAPVATWHGITVANNKVIAIELHFNNLSGTLPASLGHLLSLQRLELSFNPIGGTLPNELGNLSNLEVLALNATSLSGTIPESLGQLTKLKQLHLSSNQLTGVVPESVTNLKEIEVFNVFDNNLTGALPKGLANCPYLRELVVAENEFTNPDDFSVMVLSNTGSKLNLLNSPIQRNPSEHIIALEGDENVD